MHIVERRIRLMMRYMREREREYLSFSLHMDSYVHHELEAKERWEGVLDFAPAHLAVWRDCAFALCVEIAEDK